MKVAAYEIKKSPFGNVNEFLFEYELDGVKPIPSIGDLVDCGEFTRNLTMKVASREFKFLFNTVNIYLEA